MQSFFRSALLMPLSSVLLLSSCASMPSMDHLLSMRPFEGLSLTSKSKVEAWPADQWWLNYNDPQLNALIDEAYKGSPSLQMAAARLQQAEGIARESGASLYPQADISASVQKTKQSYNQGVPANFVPKGFQWTPRATVDLKYQLDFWGRNRALVDAAISEREAARLEATQAQLSLSTAITETYADLIQQYASLDAAQDAHDVRHKTAALFKTRLDSGLENESSYDQQLALEDSADADIETLNESIALTKNKLALLMGADPSRAQTIERPKADLKAHGLPTTLPASFIGRRPDILAAKYRTEAAAKRIKIAKTAFYPNIDLAAYFGHQSLGLDVFTKSGSAIGAFGPAITLPIFEGGRIEGEFMQAQGEYNLSVAQYNDTLLKALNDVANAATSQKYLGIRLKKLRQAAASSERAYQVSLNRYKGGLSTYLDVLRAEDTLIANRRALADIRARALVLDVQMIRALGGGFEEKSKSEERK